MSILFAAPWDQRHGGVTHVVASLAKLLEARGHAATFLFPTETGFGIRLGTSKRGFSSIYCRLRDYPPDGASWRARASWYSTVCVTLPQIVRQLRERAIDLINVHYPGDSTALLLDAARRLELPLVVSAHGSDLLHDSGPLRGRGLLRLLGGANSVVVPSQTYQHQVTREYEQVRKTIQHIYNGYDEQEIPSAVTPTRESGAAVTALCIAALIPKKGIDTLLRGMGQSSSARLQLRLIGEGPLRFELESLSAALGLAGRVTFIGSQERAAVLAELASCDFLVMPSRSESFGLATLEAMAFGRPVIASAIGGLRELVDDGETGFLVAPDDPAALAHAIDVVTKDRLLRVRLGEAGRRKAERFTASATADRYELLFKRLIAHSRSRSLLDGS